MMHEADPATLPASLPGADPLAASDEALLAALAREEHGALGLLYDRYGTLVYGLAYRILRERGAAEEVAQDVFLQAWRRAASFNPERGGARTWLLSIAHHRAIDRLRGKAGRARQADSLDEMPPPAQPRVDPWDAVDWRLLREQLRGAFARLPPAQREAVSWAYFDGYTAPEIAQRQGVPLGTVKGRLRLGLQALRGELGHLADPRNLAPRADSGSAGHVIPAGHRQRHPGDDHESCRHRAAGRG